MLFRLKRTVKAATPPPEISGIPVRVSSRARRMSLRVDTKTGDVVFVWARRTTPEKAARFIEDNRRWIELRRAEKIERHPVADGMTLDVLGVRYTVHHAGGRGLARFDGDRIVVHGSSEHMERRLKDFLKKTAQEILTEKSTEKSFLLGLSPPPVRVIDPKTRWGSCGADGKLMYSWRLILTPPDVLDYVVAHEVAHRVHMNHSRRFWALCLSLCDNGVASRRWLKKNGQNVMAFF
jgi:predicted metal-dependent hydrolase